MRYCPTPISFLAKCPDLPQLQQVRLKEPGALVFLESCFVKGFAASRAGARTGSRRMCLKCVDFWCPLNVLLGFLSSF